LIEPARPTPRGSAVPRLFPGARVHLVGAGGTGMSALATVLLERGHPVTGSDLRYGRECATLAALGAQIRRRHDPANVEGADLVAASTAVPARNPELRRAAELGIPVLRRADLLAALMADARAVCVAGTHGKTTTTAMTTVALQAAGFDPSFAIGGTLSDAGTSAHHGAGEIFVAEADESDRSFLVYEPDCAVVTNVELDHHDHFADLDEVKRAFASFLSHRTPGAPAIVCLEDPGVRALLAGIEGPIVGYGQTPEAALRLSDLRAGPAGSSFSLTSEGEDLGRFDVRAPGRHNMLNASAAVAVALWAKAPLEPVRRALAAYRGTQRRFQRLGTVDGITVVDDYAHHPTELTATIAAARQTQPSGRVVAAFQPHRFSRTAALGPELGVALGAADVVVVTAVYAAGEAPVPGVTAALVADAARRTGAETHLVRSRRDLAPFLAERVRPGDLVLTLGAGDITEIGPVLLRLLEGSGEWPASQTPAVGGL
jgi:UDP-N-acetylmuramate--alanine ligase